MNFSSLVLMERDKNKNIFLRELGSYEVNDGAEYITKMYYDGEKVNVYFDTNKDVEDWEYTAIFDLFDDAAFEGEGYEIEEVEDEYNPTWKVTFPFIEEHEEMEKKLKALCDLILEEVNSVFEAIKGKKDLYE